MTLICVEGQSSKWVNRVDSGDGVASLTDMFGGTPSSLATFCMSRPNVDVLAVNRSFHADQVSEGASGPFPAGSYRPGPEGRSQIRHHREQRACRQMNTEGTPKEPPTAVTEGAAAFLPEQRW